MVVEVEEAELEEETIEEIEMAAEAEVEAAVETQDEAVAVVEVAAVGADAVATRHKELEALAHSRELSQTDIILLMNTPRSLRRTCSSYSKFAMRETPQEE